MDLTSALVGGLVGGFAAAVLTGFVTLLFQRRQHEHERERDREERVQRRRERAYERMLVQAYRLAMSVDRTEPLWTVGSPPPPPEPPPDGEIIKLNASTGAYASKKAREAVLRLSRAAREFQAAVRRLSSERTHGGPALVAAHESADAARKTLREALEALTEQVNRELQSAEVVGRE